MDTDTRTRPQAAQVAPEAQSTFGALHSLVTEFITGGGQTRITLSPLALGTQ